jgi:hypothetical protein
MTALRISLDAARIIALTAAIGFVDGNFKIEDTIFSRNRIALVTSAEQMISGNTRNGGKPGLSPGRTAYLIEIRHGDAIREVLVDTATGRILL